MFDPTELRASHEGPAEDWEPGADLLTLTGVGTFLRWKYGRPLLQALFFGLALVVVLDGIFGPQLAPKNLATTLIWVHFRGLLALTLLVAGNFFCMGCPFVLARDWARKWITPQWTWPRSLRNKWLSTVLLFGILFSYEAFSLWSTPYWTAWLVVGYFAAAVAVDSLFKHAAFCKFVCPIGQFNFLASTLSPFEVKIRSRNICDSCRTKDCIKGTHAPAASGTVVIQRGCELALFQPAKVGNMDCTFCLDCVHACPADNIGIQSRPPASELVIDPRRSGIGRFSRRGDIAALIVVFTFGALMNALGMIAPVYALEQWMAAMLHVHNQTLILGILFLAVIVVAPVLLLNAAAWTSSLGSAQQSYQGLRTRYCYALLPLGFGMWLAHYSFHLLTGLYTVVPITQNALASLGVTLLGSPQWRWVGLPLRVVQPIQFAFLLFGLIGSIAVTLQLARVDAPARTSRLAAPWILTLVIVFAATVWVIAQPMDMRAAFLE